MKFARVFFGLILGALLCGWFSAAASEISPAGQQLTKVLDSMHVEQHWLAGRQVDWRTGEPNGKVYTNAALHTHCSAFAAAAAEKFDIYLLRPPEHSSVLLANAQQTWLCGNGTNAGWQPVKTSLLAQALANEGQLVVVTCRNPDAKRPGHIAIVRPSTKGEAAILDEGPEIIQAGQHNHADTTTKDGFKNHPGAFESGQLLYFSHVVSISKFSQQDVIMADQPASLPTTTATLGSAKSN